MSVEWKEEFALGVQRIDLQHQELFRQFDELIAACRQGQGRDRVGELLGFLEEYVDYHFKEEEGLMLAYAYPELEAHRRLHRTFVGRLKDLKRILAEEGSSIHLVSKTNETVLQWLIQHIRKADGALGKYLRRQEK